jgi:endoglucanase
MKYRRFLNLVVIAALVVTSLSFVFRSAQAQTSLPTASQVASQMTVGWNIGNTLESTPCGETAWGNPMVTQQLINSVKAAGFNSVRIPAAWDCHATNNTIDAAWMARVKQVVDYAISQNMYVILNIHWDGGWLENHVTFADQSAVNTKQNAYWTQIANTFKTYNEHLLFAGTNEVHQDYNTPTAENNTVQQSYNQTFVNAVRATGGNNASRTLVVQTYNTNIQHGLNFFNMPTDTITNHLIVEVHYYDPYDYTLNPSGPCLAWGTPYTQYSQCSWAQESYVDTTFAQVKAKWVNAGIPVIIGEYGVVKRSGLDLNSRQYWLKYINTAARNNGIKTFYWDNGISEFALFDRNSGAIVDQGALTAILQGAGIGGSTNTPTRTPTRTNTPAVSNTPTRTPTRTATAGGPTATKTNTPLPVTPTRTSTPGTGGTCSPVTSTITAPFTFDGAGTFCWQSSSLGTYINSWNTNSVTINGVNISNVYMASGSYPAKIGGFWYVAYNSSVAWGHIEAK